MQSEADAERITTRLLEPGTSPKPYVLEELAMAVCEGNFPRELLPVDFYGKVIQLNLSSDSEIQLQQEEVKSLFLGVVALDMKLCKEVIGFLDKADSEGRVSMLRVWTRLATRMRPNKEKMRIKL